MVQAPLPNIKPAGEIGITLMVKKASPAANSSLPSGDGMLDREHTRGFWRGRVLETRRPLVRGVGDYSISRCVRPNR